MKANLTILKPSTKLGPIENQSQEVVEIDWSDNPNVEKWNEALSKATNKNIKFSLWTLASLDKGLLVVTSDCDYILSKK